MQCIWMKMVLLFFLFAFTAVFSFQYAAAGGISSHRIEKDLQENLNLTTKTSLCWTWQVLPICSDSQCHKRCLWALPSPGLWGLFQKYQIPIALQSQQCPLSWPPLIIIIIFYLSSHHGPCFDVGAAPQTYLSSRNCPVQQPTTLAGPAKERLWYFYPTWQAGDLSDEPRLCWDVWSALISPLYFHHATSMAETQAMNPRTINHAVTPISVTERGL